MNSLLASAHAAGFDQAQLKARELAEILRVPPPISLLRLIDGLRTAREEVLVRGLNSDQYEAKFLLLEDQGWMPVWIDAYQVDGETFFNAIWRRSDGVPWIAKRNMGGAGFQTEFDRNQQNGYRLTNLRSYRDGSASDGGSRYAAIWRQEPGPAQQVYFGKPLVEHQALFESLSKEGYVPVNLSVVHLASTRRVSGLYEKRDAGSVVSQQTLEWGDVQSEIAANKKAGRHLVYLTSWKTVSAESAYSAIFWQKAPGHGDTSVSYTVPYDLFDDSIDWHTKQNTYVTRCLTGAEQGSGDEGWHHGYSAVWRRL
jgi:polyglycine hydrolase-like protein